MKNQKNGYLVAIMFFISSSSINYLLKSLGISNIGAIVIQGILFGFGLGWLFCFLILKKYLPK
jgi:hypothetical protein